MKKHVRDTRLTRGERQPPAWVEVWKRRGLPEWNCPTPDDELPFKSFILTELDRRIDADLDAKAAKMQSAETRDKFLDLVASGWKSVQGIASRRRGRPMADPVARLFVDAEQAARLTTTVREIFEDYWDKWNRGRPSAEELAAEYIGIRAAQVRVRKKRPKHRRPSI